MNATFTPFHRGGAGTPMVCVHGFTDTWRSWELVLPALEREHDVLAVTLVGHAGGPAPAGGLDEDTLADALERAMDEAGFADAHLVGNSLGGYVALQLARRARARSLVLMAPAGGWAHGDETYKQTLEHFKHTQELVKAAVPYVDQLVASVEGRRTATQFITTNFEHIPPELIAHQVLGVANCTAVEPLIELALREGWSVDAEGVSCPARVVWGTADRLLEWPAASVRYREELPDADWVTLDGIGHCPQLDVPDEAAELILGVSAR
ncbi:MAG TPA: alpha/beta fold hydrolase [Solirubrobacteraceae bacterium]|jgi:pimeloyl-ACP methyl ester carboxylesterase|nr:alpha/beta fold hydrolase [Solirubrobacteraceae bacterium]